MTPVYIFLCIGSKQMFIGSQLHSVNMCGIAYYVSP